MPTRQYFARCVVDCFNQQGKFDRVEQWACALEHHRKGPGVHYHLAIKLNGTFRWKAVKERLTNMYGVVVHFRNFTTGYYDAYRYVTKSDRDVVLSVGHETDVCRPGTRAAMAKRASSQEEGSAAAMCAKKKPRRMDVITLHNVIIENNIKKDLELCNYAKRQMKAGDVEFARYVLGKDERSRTSLLKTAWKMENAESDLERCNKTRMELLTDALNGPCVDGCSRSWLGAALDNLIRNKISVGEFAGSVRTLLQLGRGKGRNIMIIGESGRGKTFMIKPLLTIFKCFATPSRGTFNWVGADQAEVLWLNDFRWSEQVIPWSDFLNLLEGEAIHVPVPKTHFTEDPLWTKDTAIFATSKGKIRKCEKGQIDEIETEMMDRRWKYFFFKCEVEDEVKFVPCPKCFATLVLKF